MSVMRDMQRRSNINIIKDSKGKRGKNNVIKLDLNQIIQRNFLEMEGNLNLHFKRDDNVPGKYDLEQSY